MRMANDPRAAAPGRGGRGRSAPLPMSVVLLLLTLLGAAAPASAQFGNWFVLTPDIDHPTSCLRGGNVTVYLLLHVSRNHDYGDGEYRPVTLASGCEFRLTGSGSAAIGVVIPAAPARMISDEGNYAILYDAPLPVDPYGSAVLATATVLMVDPAADPIADQPADLYPCEGANGAVYLTAPAGGTVPGSMVYFDAEDPVDPAVEATTGVFPPSDPVLLLAPAAVPAEGRAWGAIKAQYR